MPFSFRFIAEEIAVHLGALCGVPLQNASVWVIIFSDYVRLLFVAVYLLILLLFNYLFICFYFVERSSSLSCGSLTILNPALVAALTLLTPRSGAEELWYKFARSRLTNSPVENFYGVKSYPSFRILPFRERVYSSS